MEFGKSLKSLYLEYGHYHRNLYNRLVHIFCVPLISVTLLSLGNFVPFFFVSPFLIRIHLGIIVLLGIGLWYSFLDLLSALITEAICLIGCVYMNWLYDIDPFMSFLVIIVVQVVGWGLQIFMHKVFEHNAPAVADNVLLIFAAPLFVVVEVMFWLGYKKDTYEAIKRELALKKID